MTRQPPESRDVSLGPGIPRVTLEPLDLPAAEPATPTSKCWFCNGDGRALDASCTEVACDVCGGSGRQIGGAA